MSKTNIIIVSDEPTFSENLKTKIVLLREVDNVLSSNYKNAYDFLSENPTSIIAIDGKNSKETVKLVKQIKSDIRYKSLQILVFLEFYSDEYAFELFDNGINDYILKSATDAEILMRMVWTVQRCEKQQQLNSNSNLLNSLGVIEGPNEIYTPKYCKQVFEAEIINAFKNLEGASFMIISPDVSCRQRLSVSLLGSIIKSVIRNTDILGYADNYKFYLLLPKTKTKGIFTIYEKIKTALNDEYSVSVGATELKTDKFSDIETCVNKAVDDALKISDSIIIANNINKATNENWLEKINANQKNFKLFKQTFLKKLKNVISPVFFQMQKLYEEKLFETQINQFSTETQSVFELRNKNFASNLKITYPGFSKINIDIDYGFSKKPLERMSMDLNKLNDKVLSEILEKFIKDYRQECNKK